MWRRDFLRVGAGLMAGAGMAKPRRTAAATARSPSAGARRFNEETIAGIERVVPQRMQEKAVPGVALAIIHDGKLAWHRGFGVKDVATKAPVADSTVFEAASVSKTAFAYVALKLCERGTLGLDTPLTRFSRKRFVDDARIDRVTPRHALAHTTGFPEWRSGSGLTFDSNPGERFRYSGEGYYYLQSVISEVAGRKFDSPCGRYEGDFEVCATDFDAFMRRSLLGPLAMTASGYVWRDDFEHTAARPHDVKGQPLAKKRPNAADVARYGAAGELRTTVTDYAKFLLAVMNLPAGEAFLTAASRNEMVRPQIKLDPAEKIDGADSWALGWAVQQRPSGHVILHSGGQAGFRSLTMASLERKSGFVIFTNSDSGGYLCYDQELGELLTPLLAG